MSNMDKIWEEGFLLGDVFFDCYELSMSKESLRLMGLCTKADLAGDSFNNRNSLFVLIITGGWSIALPNFV